MKVKTVDFIKSAANRSQWPPDAKHCVAFAGRSNVGKSSLINRLVGRKALVRVSKTPGRTQLLNFFLVNGTHYLVDLPGYGYAKAPAEVRKQWGPMIREFVEDNERCAAVVSIMDARHLPSKDDLGLLDWLESKERATIPVLTKADKVKAQALAKNIREAIAVTGLDREDFSVVSAEDGRGIPELWARIVSTLPKK